MKKFFFLSTAIDYPSERPHLGHALEKIQADVVARFKRQEGFKVHFSTGLDAHGLKIQRYARKANQSPEKFVEKMEKYFRDLWKKLNISNDDFIVTTEKRHQKVVEKIIKKIYQKGDIYKGKYRGLYCLDCESFYLPKDLKENKCPIHQKALELIEEEGYFFRTSRYQKYLIEHIKKNKKFIVPLSRRKEILNRLKEPIQDLSISRKTVKWGIPFPLDKKLTTFVWLEALINYLTTLNYPLDKFKKFWPAEIHIIGKDIIWHHSVIWGSLLLSLGLPLPKTIFVHGFITINGQKMSKSLGNIIDPFELVEKYGSEAVRYFLLREIPPTEDGDFSEEKFKNRYNADLASGLGNLIARIMTLAEKGKLFGLKEKKKSLQDIIIEKEVNHCRARYKKALAEFKFNEALIAIWELITFSDRYLEQERPWELLKERTKKRKLKIILNNLFFILDNLRFFLQPFLPVTSEEIEKQLKEGRGQPLFPRL